MMPLSSNNASMVRVASAFDILVRMARAEVSSALFTAISLMGGAETRMDAALLWGIPQKTASLLDFLDPPPRARQIQTYVYVVVVVTPVPLPPCPLPPAPRLGDGLT